MYSVIIIGYGNVGQALTKAIQDTDEFFVNQVYCRNPRQLSTLPSAPMVSDLTSLKEADIYLVCVSDDAIAWVAEALPFNDRLVAHTSGSIPLHMLGSQERAGVFYPLQTFTSNQVPDWKTIPLCLEVKKEEDMKLLKLLGKSLSQKVYEISSEQRKKLHLAAVIVNNFVNHLYYLGEGVCKEHDIPFEILHPLIMETAEKVQKLAPYDAQTGPARRNDQKTLNSQLLQVKDTPLEEIYQTLTSSIVATYGREKL